MSRFKAFNDEINKYVRGVHRLNEGATEEEVEQAEKDLNIKLPQLYKEFLMMYNGGEIFFPGGTEIFKVLGKNEEVKNGIGYLNKVFDSSRIAPKMLESFLPIAKKSYGDIICIHLKNNVVIQYSHETNEIDQIWDDVVAWVIYEMEIGGMMVDYDGSDKELLF